LCDPIDKKREMKNIQEKAKKNRPVGGKVSPPGVNGVEPDDLLPQRARGPPVEKKSRKAGRLESLISASVKKERGRDKGRTPTRLGTCPTLNQ